MNLNKSVQNVYYENHCEASNHKKIYSIYLNGILDMSDLT
jgi:hypothetical protein